MKRTGNLKNIWCSYEALLKAWREVRQGKTYRNRVIRFERDLAGNLEAILKNLEAGTYRPKPYFAFTIFDPKERLIQAPALEDRIVHHALMFAITKPIESRLIDQTFACRVGKGTHRAHQLLRRYLAVYGDSGYCLKVDVKKYFFSIDHEVLKSQVQQIIKCEETLNLLFKFFENESGKGLPLGSVTSQLLANLALNPIDHYLKRQMKCRHVVRYMDDIIILHKDKGFLREVLSGLGEEIAKLKLEFNGKTKISLIKDGVDFVGYRTWYNKSLIRKRSLYKIKRTLKHHGDKSRIASFVAHAKRTSSIDYVMRTIKETCPAESNFATKCLIFNR